MRPADDRIRQSMAVLMETLRSCESCRTAQAQFLVYETFVCADCAEVAR